MGAGGTAHAVWHRDVGGGTFMPASAVRSPGGPWTPAGDLGTAAQAASGGAVPFPRVAVAADGTATAVWIGGTAASGTVHSATRPSGGTWSSPVTLAGPGPDLFRTRIAVNGRGDAVAIWAIRPAPPQDDRVVVQARHRPAGGDWAPTETVHSQPGITSVEPDVAIDASGNAVAIWVDSATQRQAFLSRRPAAGP